MGSLVHGAVLQGRRYEARLEVWADGLRMTLDDPYTDGCTLKIRRGRFSKQESLGFFFMSWWFYRNA